MRAKLLGRRRARSDSCSSPARQRHEVGDDRWPPPVGVCGSGRQRGLRMALGRWCWAKVGRVARRGETRLAKGGAAADFCLAGLHAKPGRKRGGVKEERERVLHFQKRHKQMNSNSNLNSNNQRQCTSMNATINSYSSFILF
jgi:hypothetical protein